jgi:hypothetical protein
VAVIGVVFFDADTVADAFVVSLWVLAGLTGATALLAQFLRPNTEIPDTEITNTEIAGT